MNRKWVLVMTVLLLLIAVTPVWAGGRKLADRELDQVTAGDFTIDFLDGALKLQFESSAGPHKSVSGEGTIAFTGSSLTGTPGILLTQDAQQNLRSLVNINAVSSNVNVLLNLVINVNSTVNGVTQGNLVDRP
jgi:hypothetical protein